MSQTHTDDPGFSTKGAYVTGGEEFTRDTNYIEDRITRDGAPGRNGEPGWPVEPGRYRLIAARACPWANRTVIVRRLLGLEDVISLGQPGPTHDARSWTFDLDPGRQGSGARDRADPGGVLPPVPGLSPRHHRPGDRRRRQRAGGDQQLPPDHAGLLHRVGRYHRPGAPDLYPEALRGEIDAVNKRVFTEVNNGVYRCGFAGSQEAYDAAYNRLWTALDWLEERLTGQRYLVGDTITEADVRLFTTLARFDAVYHGHFKCNRQKLSEMPALWAYARDLFQTPGFGDTIDFVQIKQHYYIVHEDINPTGIVPAGPELGNWLTGARPRSAGRPSVRRRNPAGPGPGRGRSGPRTRRGLSPQGWARPGSSSCRSNIPALG